MPTPLQEYKLEQCEELHLVECGARTELEPAISTTNCPRLWGTFADPEDCGVFWKCQDGKANRSVIGRATRGKHRLCMDGEIENTRILFPLQA